MKNFKMILILLLITILASCVTVDNKRSAKIKDDNAFLLIKIKHWENNEIALFGKLVFTFMDAATLEVIKSDYVAFDYEHLEYIPLPGGLYWIEFQYQTIDGKLISYIDEFEQYIEVKSNKINIPPVGIDIDFEVTRSGSISPSTRPYPLSEDDINAIKRFLIKYRKIDESKISIQ